MQSNKNQKSASTKAVSIAHISSETTEKLVDQMQHSEKQTITCQSSSQDVQMHNTESIIDIIDSDNDEEVTCSNSITEPIITRVETKDQIKKHIEQLSVNPKLFQDEAWKRKVLSSKNFVTFGIVQIQIGSLKTLSVSFCSTLVCVHGIRMSIYNSDYKTTIIDIPIKNIVKIYGNYSVTSNLIIYTDYLAAVGIHYLLNINKIDIKNNVDHLSKDIEEKTIIWKFNVTNYKVNKLKKILMTFNEKYEKLTKTKFNSFVSLIEKKKNEKLQPKLSYEDGKIDPNTVLFIDILEDRRVIVKIKDYELLSIGIFINDILIEFYMNRWFMLMLSADDKKRTYVFNSQFYEALNRKISVNLNTTKLISKARHNNAKKWTKNVNVFEKDFIFLPINESSHWFLIVICFPYLTGPVNIDDGATVETSIKDADFSENQHFTPSSSKRMKTDAVGYTKIPERTNPYYLGVGSSYEKDIEILQQQKYPRIKQPCILVFDSINNKQYCHTKNVSLIREWLMEEYRVKHNGAERDFSADVVKEHTVKVPKQTNNFDCGLFLLHFFEKFFQRPIIDYSLPILHLKNWFLADEIQKNCQKRRDVANMIQKVFREKSPLPPGVLPPLVFTSKTHRTRNSHYESDALEENLKCDDYSRGECSNPFNNNVDKSEDNNLYNHTESFPKDDYNNDENFTDIMNYESTEERNNEGVNADSAYFEQSRDNINQYSVIHSNLNKVIFEDVSLNDVSTQSNQHISNINYGLFMNQIETQDEINIDGENNHGVETSQFTSYSN